jgi:hypothetical protein
MKKMFSPCWMVSGTMAILFAQVTFAQPQMPRTTKQEVAGAGSTKTEQFSGTVLVVDGNKLVVRMASGDIRYFEPPASRRFMIDGKELTVSELKPGTKLNATVTTTVTPVTERTTTVGSGKVWYVSGNNVILTLPNGENRQYKVDPSYRFTVGGQKASVFDLKKGMTITAEKIVEEQKTVLSSNVAVTGQAPPEARPAEVAQTRAPAPAPRAEPAPAPRAEPMPAPAPPAQVAQSPRPTRLPDTGSSLPLGGAIGVILVAASFGLRMLQRR